MSEGEFTIRMREEAEQIGNLYKFWPNRERNHTQAVEKLLAIIAEATEEWRDTDNYDKAHDELGNIVAFGHQPTRDETIRILQYYLRRKNAWAHRWLGGEKAE